MPKVIKITLEEFKERHDLELHLLALDISCSKNEPETQELYDEALKKSLVILLDKYKKQYKIL